MTLEGRRLHLPFWWFVPLPLMFALIAYDADPGVFAALVLILVGIALVERVLTARTTEVSKMVLDIPSGVIHCTGPRVDVAFEDIDGVVSITQVSGLKTSTVRFKTLGGKRSYVLITKGPAAAFFSGCGLPVELLVAPPVPLS